MGILDKVKSLLPKRKEPELKNNIPNEKENIRKTFGKYCNANHGTTDNKLCGKCYKNRSLPLRYRQAHLRTMRDSLLW